MLEHEVGGLVEERPPLAKAFGGHEVEVDPAVDAAVAEVPVHRGPVVVAAEQLAEAAQVGAEAVGRYRRVLPSLPVVILARDERGGAEPGLADVP